MIYEVYAMIRYDVVLVVSLLYFLFSAFVWSLIQVDPRHERERVRA